MTETVRARTLMLVACLLLAASGCGQMGPLTLPEDPPSNEDEQGEDENER